MALVGVLVLLTLSLSSLVMGEVVTYYASANSDLGHNCTTPETACSLAEVFRVGFELTVI